jgi:hypothetical protein
MAVVEKTIALDVVERGTLSIFSRLYLAACCTI